MSTNTTLIVDGTDISGIVTDLNVTYNWIVDALRNENDYMIIANPVKKKTLSISVEKVMSKDFDVLIDIFGQEDIRHTVQAFDEIKRKVVTYQMYNSDFSFRSTPFGPGETLYSNISITLIER